MDIKEIVNSKGRGNMAAAAAATAAGQHDNLHLLNTINQTNLPLSEAGSERGNSPHDSEQSRYSGSRINQMNGLNGPPEANMQRYPSPPAMQSTMPMMQQPYRPDNSFDNMVPQQQQIQHPQPGNPPRPVQNETANPQQKAFPCSSCGKGFARRSDLARHERIHSGVRPHVCDYPGCNKQFIQRSALTVHLRVHTGEKPHMCERCGKPFSDSSSLARHRRIHSGKRPYKCPYADCQKTFTRRTTLTRHQNHHTGTVEEAAAATAAALATRTGPTRAGRQQRSDGEQYSNTGSPMSTPSPGQRNSPSPHAEMAPMAGAMQQQQQQQQQRHPQQEYTYMNNSPLPGHLRGPGEYHVQSQQIPPPATAAYSNGMRPTSHPTGYGPPAIMEPPANMERQPGSASGSPHMGGNMGWQSPSQNMPSPSYSYPDPDPYGNQQAALGQMYYPASNLRRPASTEPQDGAFEMKPRMQQQQHQQIQGNDLWQAPQ